MRKNASKRESAEKNKTKKNESAAMRKTLAFMLKTAAKERPSLYVLYVLELIVNQVQTFSGIFLSKFIIDELVGDKNVDKIICYVVTLILVQVLSSLSINLIDAGKSIHGNWLDLHFQRLLSEKSITMEFENTENPAVLDQQGKAQDGMAWYSGGVVGILSSFNNIISNIIKLIGVVAIIVIGCPWLLPVQVAAIAIITVFVAKSNRMQTENFKGMSKLNRIFGYYMFELVQTSNGKDIRLYDSAKMMMKKTKSYNTETCKIWKKQSRKDILYSLPRNLANTVRDGFTYMYIGWLAITKTITIGDFSMYTASASVFFWSLHNALNSFQDVLRRTNYAYEFVKFLDYPSVMHSGDKKLSDGEHTIEFKDVSFKYARTENYVLKNFSLTLHAGEHLSVVGLNGAGKTTFIKLLCRLYDVSEGEILLDGVNIKEYSDDEYRRLFSVVFQDFKLFAFSLAENIAMSDEQERERMTEIFKLVDFEKDAEKLPSGLDTVISKQYDENGTELSGGQQQKTAIARALYKNAPVVILDEPTAALDPIAEYEIYKQFNTLVGGKTAIYISHRLSSCKFCDRIAVFSDGRIAEYGTHDELVDKVGGIYAEMFKAQAQYYVSA